VRAFTSTMTDEGLAIPTGNNQNVGQMRYLVERADEKNQASTS
jgi:hypothetical protein